MENKIINITNEGQMKLKNELSTNLSVAMSKVETRMTTFDINQKETANKFSVKVDVLTKREESHHQELISGLDQMDDMRNRLNASNRKIEEMSDMMTSEITREAKVSDKKLQGMRCTMEEAQISIKCLQDSFL